MEWNVPSRTRAVWAVALLLGSVGCQSEPAQDERAAAGKAEIVAEAPAPPADAEPNEAPAADAKPAQAPAAAADADEFDDDLVLFAEGLPEEDGPAPLEVRFSVESLIGGEMDGPKFTWDFGDGSPPSNEASPVHKYEKPGEYTVTIRIVDATGQRGWDEIEIEVYEPEA